MKGGLNDAKREIKEYKKQQQSIAEKLGINTKNIHLVLPYTNEDISNILSRKNIISISHQQNNLDRVEFDSNDLDIKFLVVSLLSNNHNDGRDLLDNVNDYRSAIMSFLKTFTELIEKNSKYKKGKVIDLYKDFEIYIKLNIDVVKDLFIKSEEVKNIILQSKDLSKVEEKIIFDDYGKIDKNSINIINEKKSTIATKLIINYNEEILASIEGRFSNENIENSINRIEFYYMIYYVLKTSTQLNKIYSNSEINFEMIETKK